jgi:hypothetical protein
MYRVGWSGTSHMHQFHWSMGERQMDFVSMQWRMIVQVRLFLLCFKQDKSPLPLCVVHTIRKLLFCRRIKIKHKTDVHKCVYSQVLVRIQTPAVAGGIHATSACGDRCSRWSWNAAGVTVSSLYAKMHGSFRSPTSSSVSFTSLKCRDSADLKPDSGNTTLHPIRKIKV